MPYVYSTQSSGTDYVQYSPPKTDEGGNEIRKVVRRVSIKGGANVSDKRLFTPYGVVTEVSDEEAEFLLKNDSFLKHQKKGFVRLEKSEVRIEKVTADMTSKDKSAPKVEKDFEGPKKAKPILGEKFKDMMDNVLGR